MAPWVPFMRILIATDAWHPQVNGVVRTLTSLARSAASLGAEIDFLTPEGFASLAVPTYPGLRMAWPNRREIARRVEAAAPEAIHIATEGPIGWAVRAYCLRHKLAFTTSYTTRFPEYIAVRSIIPASVSYTVLRHFHAASATTMVATASLRQELAARGFRKIGTWTRGVDTDLFRPDEVAELDLPRPIFMTMGRVAVEKNLEAFLALDLPGTKVVILDGPQRAALAQRYPKARFLGEKTGRDLTMHLAAADVFVFPSLTDTFGVVQLEALACGTPVAAFPVTGPLDVIADHPVGALDTNLAHACMRALGMSRETCRGFALERSWENSARQFIGNLSALQPSRSWRPARRVATRGAVQG
jgi:glycosyltransferase involved in cell wall biosynthesis